MTRHTLLLIAIFLFFPLYITAQETFPLPDVPKTLKGVEARANYLASHYWDKIDFTDNALVGNKDISEQGFSNFISIMPYVTEKEAAFDCFASKLVSNSRLQKLWQNLELISMILKKLKLNRVLATVVLEDLQHAFWTL